MTEDGSNWVVVYRSLSHAECLEQSVVLQVAGITHQIAFAAETYSIRVTELDAERSRAELDAYATENRDRPTIRPTTLTTGRGWSGVAGFATVLALAAVLQQPQSFGVDWLDAGRAHAGLIRAGQWWRTVTALTLHVDLAHLLANVLIGGLVGLFAGQSLGSGLGWFGILLGGAFGNLLNALLRPAGHTSVGASTAVFAAVGLQAAVAWRQRRKSPTSRMERWVPLIGGVLLLSFLGTGGGRTDIAAHVFGFACGGLVGGLFGTIAFGKWSRPQGQILFGVTALAILVASWALAVM